MAQTPSLGRVVLVLVAPVTNNGSDIAPGTIVRAHAPHADGSCIVNLKVDLDASTTAKWITSARLFDTEADARAHGGPAAFWPPRVR